MRVNSVLDVFGALILLALASVLIKHPQIVTTTLGGFNKALATAKG